MKQHEDHAAPAFDEQRALEHLHQLQRDIQRARGDRHRAEEEFESFLRGFRRGEAEPAAASPTPPVLDAAPQSLAAADTASLPEIARPVEPPSVPEPGPEPAEDPATAAAPSLEAEPVMETRRPPAALVQRRPAANTSLVVTIAAVVVIAGLLALRSRRAEPGPDDTVGPTAVITAPAETGTSPAPAQEESEAASSSAAQAEAAAPPSGVNLEIATLRPVWVRVTIDGNRAIERELAANQQIPLHATGSILIRAGDAGALVVRRPGRPEARLGPDGIVVTREFTTGGSRAPAPPR